MSSRIPSQYMIPFVPGSSIGAGSYGSSNPALSAPSLSTEQALPFFEIAEFPSRTVAENWASYTGLGAEAARSSYGQAEDRTLRWDLHAMRDRVLLSAREAQPHIFLPETLQRKYHGLFLLDSVPLPSVSACLGYATSCYKALSGADPFVYCLRRVEGFRLSNFDLVQEAVAAWTRVSHPNVVGLRQAFATGEFTEVDGVGEGGSLVYVYDYVDLAYTLSHWHEAHDRSALSETLLWDIALQLLSGVRAVHAAGLAVRVLHPSKVLVGPRVRIMINCAGLLDALHHPSVWQTNREIPDKNNAFAAQRRDMVCIGKILQSLAVGGESVWDVGTLTSSEQHELVSTLPSSLSRSFTGFIKALISGDHSAAQLTASVGYMYSFKAEQQLTASDRMHAELRKSVDVGRLFQLLTKVNSIADRPGGLLEDWKWAATGDRFLVGLFRDYLFFQADEFGRPTTDLSHVVDALAKVDVGSAESLMLSDREGGAVLVVSFMEIRRCIDSSFKQLVSAGTGFLL